MTAHAYGPHRTEDAPTTVPVFDARAGDRTVPLHPALVAQRARINAIAHGGGGQLGKATALAAVNDAASEEDKARIDAAILTVARRGGVFSANDFRHLFPESGGLIGARVNALSRRYFTHVGYVPSSKANTNGHEIKTWRLREDVAA